MSPIDRIVVAYLHEPAVEAIFVRWEVVERRRLFNERTRQFVEGGDFFVDFPASKFL